MTINSEKWQSGVQQPRRKPVQLRTNVIFRRQMAENSGIAFPLIFKTGKCGPDSTLTNENLVSIIEPT